MPKKVIYTREEIIEKAYEMLKSEGLNQITARTLAKKLKTSPAPIYGHFDSMEVLKDELVKKAREQFLNYIIKNYTEKITSLNSKIISLSLFPIKKTALKSSLSSLAKITNPIPAFKKGFSV